MTDRRTGRQTLLVIRILTGGRAVANILPITLKTLNVKKHTTAMKYS